MSSIEWEHIQFDWAHWGGIQDEKYALYGVMIPEAICLLVMEDIGVHRDEALEIMRESKEFAAAGNSRVE